MFKLLSLMFLFLCFKVQYKLLIVCLFNEVIRLITNIVIIRKNALKVKLKMADIGERRRRRRKGGLSRGREEVKRGSGNMARQGEVSGET